MGGGSSVVRDEECKTIPCNVWVNPQSPDFIYPELQLSEELQLKENFGVALSGGGFRACTLAVGLLRGLQELGLLKKCRYISSNSGGSWCSVPLCYSGKSAKELLGDYCPPENIVEKSANFDDNCSSRIAECCTSKSTKPIMFVKELIQGVAQEILDVEKYDIDRRGFWSQAISKIFCDPFGLGGFDQLPAVEGSQFTSLLQRTRLERSRFAPVSLRDVPFPIVNASVHIGGDACFAPIEFTPLYYGIPKTYSALDESDKAVAIGGYLTEPHGFACSVEKHKKLREDNVKKINKEGARVAPITIQVPCGKAMQVISVSEQAGISSSAMAEGVANEVTSHTYKLMDMPVYTLWSPKTNVNKRLKLLDGAGSDNSAILPLLCRKVAFIVSCCAMNVDISDPSIKHHFVNESSFGNVAALFGRMDFHGDLKYNDGVPVSAFNDMRRVFPSEHYDVLLAGLQARARAGGPASFLLHTRVLPNTHANVHHSYDVKILFVLNCLSAGFKEKLPKPIQQRLHAEQDLSVAENSLKLMGVLKEDLHNFPYAALKHFSYTNALANMMCHLMAWSVVESADALKDLIHQAS